MFIHYPISNTKKIETTISKKENTKVNYVLTTSLESSRWPMDIYYRENKHPKFDNNYFSIFYKLGDGYITNADVVESMYFTGMMVDGDIYYSSYNHDFVNAGKYFIYGGRDYVRTNNPNTLSFTVKNGLLIVL